MFFVFKTVCVVVFTFKVFRIAYIMNLHYNAYSTQQA